MAERRKDDENIAELLVLVKQVHTAVFGNGKLGIKAEMERFKGALSVCKWIAGGGGAISIILLIIKFIERS